MVKPHITLLLLLALGLACLGLMLVFPADGISVGGYTLRFKSWNSLSDSTQTVNTDSLENYLAAFDSLTMSLDSNITDTALNVQRTITSASLQFADSSSASLFGFFAQVEKAKNGGEAVHIFHYGDSQIESDRMSNVIREKFQEVFGGSGCGLVSPVPITASASISQTWSDNFKRYTAYGFDDGKVSHNDYGVMCSFGRFTPPLKKDQTISTDTTKAWLEFKPSHMATGRCKNYSQVRIYFQNKLAAFVMRVYADQVLLEEKNIEAAAGVRHLDWNLETAPGKLRIEFEATESPEIHAICLTGKSAVNLSNIALRGNDGGAFKRVNASSVQPVLQDLNAGLIILQFGGNAVPWLTSDETAFSYGKAFRTHIQYFKRMAPDAAIILVGPSDMSTSINGEYQTWPHLESLKNGLKQAAFDEGCAFWDMFEVMGGRNSMLQWVNHNPAWAGPDHTHFTPAGARKVADLLVKAIMDEYNAWKKASGS